LKVKFIGQGLEGNGSQVGELINETLKSSNFSEFYAFVAFVSESGIDRISEGLECFISKEENKVHFYVGVDNKATSKEALEALLELKIPTSIFHTLNKSVIYHPKVYLFKGKTEFRVITGSSNLTLTGLYQNVETSILVDSENSEGQVFLNEIEAFFLKVIEGNDPNLVDLDETIVEKLHQSGKLPSEASQRYTGDGITDPPGAEDEDNGGFAEDLKSLFPGRGVPTTPPRRTAKTVSGVVTGSTPVVPGGGVVTGSTSVVPGTGTGSGITPVPAGIVTPTTPGGIGARRTLWFQTGKLTGGSANILDLSLSGKGGGSGGVHLLNPSLSITRHITLRLHGTDYYNNLVIFPQTSSGESNGTWRLQMRGQSTSGQRFTQHTRLGQLKDKILVLEEISPDHYEVTVEPDSKLIHYRAISSFVEQSPPRGRYYGII